MAPLGLVDAQAVTLGPIVKVRDFLYVLGGAVIVANAAYAAGAPRWSLAFISGFVAASLIDPVRKRRRRLDGYWGKGYRQSGFVQSWDELDNEAPRRHPS